MEKIKVGIIGCGNIAPAYIKGCGNFPILQLVACADIDDNRAQNFAAQHGLKALSVAELLADPEIDIVINLTIPLAHAEVDLAIIAAGKHVYSEKPLAINRADGKRILDAAESAGVRLGCAPDTFLGGGIQTCRQVIDEGLIGQPIAATSFMVNHGHEGWHPNPHFYYDIGGGPMLDMGPYYLTALVNLLGPIAKVSASTKQSFEERVTPQGERIPVNVPTHFSGTVDFENGTTATLIKSFDIWAHHLPLIEIYGSEGTLVVPDPNRFDGSVRVWQAKNQAWLEIPLTHSDTVARGIGIADMAYALRYNRPHRANGELAYHVLDVMQAFTESSDTEKHIHIRSTCSRPAALPTGLADGELDTV